jgi:hypothetical protein
LGFEFLLMKVTGVCWMDELITMRAFIWIEIYKKHHYFQLKQ